MFVTSFFFPFCTLSSTGNYPAYYMKFSCILEEIGLLQILVCPLLEIALFFTEYCLVYYRILPCPLLEIALSIAGYCPVPSVLLRVL